MLSVLVPALAENIPLSASCVSPEKDARVQIDLDGDGTTETVSWTMAPGEYDIYLSLTVEPASGAPTTYRTDILAYSRVYIQDLDSDGMSEILLTGDVMSDDYYTWCLQYRNGTLFEVLFPDASRGENYGGYFKAGYGLVTGITEYGIVDLTGSQDVLGTWMASRRVRLDSPGRFEFCDNYLWERPSETYTDEAGLWEYAALTVKSPVPYTGDHGCASGMLSPGDQIMIYATDKDSEALFYTRDDITGILSLSRNYEKGWGWLVSGIPEEDCFEYLRYAD
jgi:hypothetical protein